MQDRGRLFFLAVAALLLAGCTGQTARQEPLETIYGRSVSAAAVSPDSADRVLRPITEEEVTVAHLERYPTVGSAYYTWVSRPDELREHCKSQPHKPLLALQMALGMPPVAEGDWKVFIFTVRRVDLFRPCASSQDPTKPKCEVKMTPGGLAQSKDEHFVLAQMINSYRGEKRFPFTAMGWSYNWDPAAKSTFGVSEYVVRPGAALRFQAAMPPAAFCAM